MDKQGSRATFIAFGIIFFVFSILFTSASISTRLFPVGHDVVLISVTVMAFCNAYLYPQFKTKDERSRTIREKGMFYSYFVILALLVILMTLFQFTSLQLNGFQTTSVIAALIIVTVFVHLLSYRKGFDKKGLL